MNQIIIYIMLGLKFISLVFTKSTNEVDDIFKSIYLLDSGINNIYIELKKEEIVIEESTKNEEQEDSKEEIVIEESTKNKEKEDSKEEIIVEPCAPRNLEQLQGKKLIAFTFDDGPNNATTLKLLEGMKQYDARATFFVLGSRVSRHKESLITAYEQCNQIGNHTYSHYNLLKKSIETVANEINSTNTAIYNLIGEYPTVIRPPYGNTNKEIRKVGNLPSILWSIDTLDWKYRNAERISNAIIEDAEDGAIILLHDLYSSSVEGALMAMEQLKDEYAFVTIEEMTILKKIKLDSTESYFKFK